MQQKTTIVKPVDYKEEWILIDATNLPVGRLATRIALILQGKHKPTYTPNFDNGDHVVVLNAEKVVFTGAKTEDKFYRHHTLYPGGLKEVSFDRMLEKHPERIIKLAVRRMLPKSILGRKMHSKLHAYKGTQHPHTAQNPVPTDLGVKRRD